MVDFNSHLVRFLALGGFHILRRQRRGREGFWKSLRLSTWREGGVSTNVYVDKIRILQLEQFQNKYHFLCSNFVIISPGTSLICAQKRLCMLHLLFWHEESVRLFVRNLSIYSLKKPYSVRYRFSSRMNTYMLLRREGVVQKSTQTKLGVTQMSALVYWEGGGGKKFAILCLRRM